LEGKKQGKDNNNTHQTLLSNFPDPWHWLITPPVSWISGSTYGDNLSNLPKTEEFSGHGTFDAKTKKFPCKSG
jgi:hypothetical protein